MIGSLIEIIKGWDGFWQFVIIVLGGAAVLAVVSEFIAAVRIIANRMIRSINVVVRGWPPEHLDADGDSVAEAVAIQEVKLTQTKKEL